MEIKEQLVEIEKKLWTNDAVFYENNLIEEAMLVFAETGPIGREFAVEAIVAENAEGRKWADVKFDKINFRQITSSVALLNYKVTARWEHEQVPVVALASTIYVNTIQGWRVAFHQQTPIGQG